MLGMLFLFVLGLALGAFFMNAYEKAANDAVNLGRYRAFEELREAKLKADGILLALEQEGIVTLARNEKGGFSGTYILTDRVKA